jgi:transcription initiation factor TFIIH subunit 4
LVDYLLKLLFILACISTRDLPELARHFVMRLLFVEQPVAQAVINQWTCREVEREQQEAVAALAELRVWHTQPVVGGMMGWILNPVFRDNAKTALLGG